MRSLLGIWVPVLVALVLPRDSLAGTSIRSIELLSEAEYSAELPVISAGAMSAQRGGSGQWFVMEAHVDLASDHPSPITATMELLLNTAKRGLIMVSGCLTSGDLQNGGSIWVPRGFLSPAFSSTLGNWVVTGMRVQIAHHGQILDAMITWKGSPQPWPSSVPIAKNQILPVLSSPWAEAEVTAEGRLLDKPRLGCEVVATEDEYRSELLVDEETYKLMEAAESK